MDLYTKFNRGLVLALVKKNVYEAVQTYRDYISYLKSNGFDKELIATRNAFLKELIEFVQNPDNIDKPYELIPAFQELMVAFSENTGIKLDCAECFNRLGQYDIALEILKDANQSDLLVKKSIANAARENGEYELAVETAKYVCEREPGVASNFCLLGTCYDALYKSTNDDKSLQSAISAMKIAHRMAPEERVFMKNLITLCKKAKDEEFLETLWPKFLAFPNIKNEDYYDYSAYLIRHGDFKNGFKYYEHRFMHETQKIFYPEMDKQKYDGKQDLSGKTLLVQSEQGYGDTILFSRFLKQVQAKKLVLGVPTCLNSILQRSLKGIEVIERFSPVYYDYHIPIMSLPYVLGITSDNIPCTGKYLYADEKKIADFKERFFKGSAFKIGISYRGNITGTLTRDMPFKELLPLTEIPGVKVYSLQFGEPDSVYKGTKIINIGNSIEDFDDSAAAIENMDLVITTDNAVLNLSGALGKKTFGLFNYLPEFRWFDLTGEDVKWYKSVKPYNCKHLNEWKPVVQKAVSDIKELIK